MCSAQSSNQSAWKTMTVTSVTTVAGTQLTMGRQVLDISDWVLATTDSMASRLASMWREARLEKSLTTTSRVPRAERRTSIWTARSNKQLASAVALESCASQKRNRNIRFHMAG